MPSTTMQFHCRRVFMPATGIRVFLLSVLLITISHGLFATVYYVDPAGSDAGSGTSPTTAWQTLTKLTATTFAPGDQILFKAGGVWTGLLAPGGSGTSDNPIVIDMYGTGNKPVLNGPGTNASATLTLLNQSYWEVNDLEITNTQTSGGTAQLTGISINNTGTGMLSHIYVKHCYVHDVNAVGVGNSNYNKGTGGIIYNGYISDVLVRGCHVANVQVEGIRNSSSTMCDHFVIDSNLIENVYGDGIVLHGVQNGSAITHNTLYNVCMSSAANFAGAWTYLSNQTTIAYNEVYGIKGGEGSNDGQAFDADISTNGDIFEYNYSHDNDGGFMLFMPSATNIIVRYNLSVNDCIGGHILKLFNYTSTSTTNKIYNNTFYLSNNINEIFQNGYNSVFSNNIIYSPGTVAKFSTTTISSSSVFNNNCFYPASITATNGPAGIVTGNINADPGFFNSGFDSLGRSAGSAYRLLTSSPCRNAGILTGNNGGIDYFNFPLPSGSPDIGAIQHTDTSTVKAVTVIPIADSYVRDGSYASTNYGAETTMVVKSDATGYNRNSYMKFDYHSFTDTAVVSALLELYVSGVNTDATRTISVYGITDTTWGEMTINWNNKPTAGTLLGTFSVSNQTGQWYQFDVTSYIQGNMTAKKCSFRLLNAAAASSKNDVSFNTKEAASGQPQLVITAKQPGGSSAEAGIQRIGTAIEPAFGSPKVIVNPNPARGTLHIQLPREEGILRMLDLNGRVLKQLAVSGTEMNLDVQSLSPGIYIINYIVRNNVQTVRVAIQR